MGGSKKSKSKQWGWSMFTMDEGVMSNLQSITDQALEISGLGQDFFKSFMLPYQKQLMQANQELLPFMTDNAKLQLQIQNADLLGESELRDQLREAAKGDLSKATELGDELFGRIKEAADVEGRTAEKRSQLEQEYSKLERELQREGVDPSSPEGRALQKELELEQTRASVQARTQAEQEALSILSGGFSQFSGEGVRKTGAGMAGSFAGSDPERIGQFQVQSDAGMGALQGAIGASGIMSRQGRTDYKNKGQSSQPSGGLGGALGNIGGGILSAGIGAFTGGFGGGLADILLGQLG